MGYTKIVNLYNVPDFVGSTPEVYCLEKIDGTSAHVKWKDGQLTFSSGGSKHETFVALFDQAKLTEQFKAIGGDWTIYGEAYGGKLQGMRETYGDALRFVAFDVLEGKRGRDEDSGAWKDVPDAEKIVKWLGLEFVHYWRGPNTLAFMDECRDKPSPQGKRNGIEADHIMEGVIVKPIVEQRDRRGNRAHYKHKRSEFMETKTPRVVDPNRVKILEDARAIADEYVVPERLKHVLSKLVVKLGREPEITDTGEVVRAMLEDVQAECGSEVKEFTSEVNKAIGTTAARLFKQSLNSKLTTSNTHDGGSV